MPGRAELLKGAGTAETGGNTNQIATKGFGLSDVSGQLADSLKDPLTRPGLTAADKWKRATNADDWEERGASKAQAHLAKLSLAQIRRMYHDELMGFLASESSAENLQFLDAVDGGMSDAGLTQRFIAKGAAKEVNVAFELRERILAGQARPIAAYGAIEQLIRSDSLTRFRKDPKVLGQIAARL